MREFKPLVQVYDSDDFQNFIEIEFINEENKFFEKVSIKVKLSPDEVYKVVEKHVGKGEFNFFARNFYLKTPEIFAKCYFDSSEKDNAIAVDDFDDFESSSTSNKKYSGQYSIQFWGNDKEQLKKVAKSISEELEKFKTNSIVWTFMTSSGGMQRKEIFIEEDIDVQAEYYPWLPTDTLEEYYNEYLNSSESILLLTGVPGTGKTTFIRNMIIKKNLNADITYDEKLMSSDQYFLSFLNDDDKDILIIEDSDHLLYDREQTDNNLLNKILNISDGIVKNVTKKIVFSTNITDIEKIDTALIRPGRCFDVLDFRKLTGEEAAHIVDMKGLEKEIDYNKEYTLAEIFASNNRKQKFKNKKMGF